MNELQKLTAQRETIQARRKRRVEADKKDRDELERLESAIKRATAKGMKGATVVLSPNRSIPAGKLRNLRGVTAIVNSVGRKCFNVTFATGDTWFLPFDMLVACTPEALADTGEVIDSVNDKLNAAFAGM